MAMPDDDFERYVREILKTIPPGLSQNQFREHTARDLQAGYRDEVTEAEDRYFSTPLS